MFYNYSKAFEHIWAKAFLVLNALKWTVSYLHQILTTKGKIYTLLFTLGGLVQSAAVTIKMCLSTVVFQASVNIFHWPKF